jgi:hypothetical protein
MIVTQKETFHIKILIHTPCFKTRAQTRGHVRGVNTSPRNIDIIYNVVGLDGEQEQFSYTEF